MAGASYLVSLSGKYLQEFMTQVTQNQVTTFLSFCPKACLVFCYKRALGDKLGMRVLLQVCVPHPTQPSVQRRVLHPAQPSHLRVPLRLFSQKNTSLVLFLSSYSQMGQFWMGYAMRHFLKLKNQPLT